jgi:hypothetical protein
MYVDVSSTFLALALHGSEWLASRPDQRTSGTRWKESGWTSQPVWKLRRKKSLPLPRIEPIFPDNPVRSMTVVTKPTMIVVVVVVVVVVVK